MGLFKKIWKGVKKVAKVGLAVGGAYTGYKALQSLTAPSLEPPGGGSSASSVASTPGPDGIAQLPRVNVQGSTATDWGKLLGAGASLGAAGLSYIGQRQTNAANAQQAQSQMDFQQRQSETQWQRATGDMKAAGLNPMLAYSQGPNGTMGGSTATMQNELDPAVSSARQTASFLAELANTKATNANIVATTENIDAQTEKAKADAIVAQEQAADYIARRPNYALTGGLTTAEANLASARGNQIRTMLPAELKNLNARTKGQQQSNDQEQPYADFAKSKAGQLQPYTEYGLSTAKDAVGMFNPFKWGDRTVNHNHRRVP